MSQGSPPQDIAAEEALIGASMLSPLVLSDVLGIVGSDDFYKPVHASIWAAIESLWRVGQPVDAVTVSGALSDRGEPDALGVLMEVQRVVPAISRAKSYADRVVRASRLRAAIFAASSIAEAAYESGADPDDVHTQIVSLASDVRLLPREITLPEDLMPLGAFIERAESRPDEEGGEWIIPSILKKRHRVLFVGVEGGGKSVLLRQFAILIGNGIHPLIGGAHRITPRRVLMIDAENPEDVVVEQSHLVDRISGEGLSKSDNVWIWHVEGGLNLRRRLDQAQMEAVIQRVQPELVTMGPVYKLYANGATDLEQSAIEFLTFLDGLRKRFGFALMMEHHAPKGSSAARDLVPFGTVAWQRWPEFGLVLKPDHFDERKHPHTLYVKRFRGDRVIAQWPKELNRSAMTFRTAPWEGTWEDGTWDGNTQKDSEPF